MSGGTGLTLLGLFLLFKLGGSVGSSVEGLRQSQRTRVANSPNPSIPPKLPPRCVTGPSGLKSLIRIRPLTIWQNHDEGSWES